MSERVRESILGTFLASNRCIVSACAAIAMVLGAMSAGSSVVPSRTPSPPLTNTASIAPVELTESSAPEERTSTFQRQGHLKGGTLILETPRYTAPPTTLPKPRKSPPAPVTVTAAFFQTQTPPLTQLQSTTSVTNATPDPTPPADPIQPAEESSTTATDETAAEEPSTEETPPSRASSDGEATPFAESSDESKPTP